MLLLCEAIIVSGCFLLATVLIMGPDTYLVLNYEYGGLKIAGADHPHPAVLLLLRPLRAAAHLRTLGDLLPPAAGARLSVVSALRLMYSFPNADIAHYVLLLGSRFLTAGAGRLAPRLRVDHRAQDLSRARLCARRGRARARPSCRRSGRAATPAWRSSAGTSMSVDKTQRKEAFAMRARTLPRGQAAGRSRDRRH